MLREYFHSPHVVKTKTLDHRLQLGDIAGTWGSRGGLMNLECGECGDFTMSGSQESHGRDGLNRSRVVEGQLNWSGSKEIVEGYPVPDKAATGLKQNMSVSMSRFTDAFDVPLKPVVLIVRNDVMPKLAQVEPLASFRDLVALCVIPMPSASA